MKGEDKREKEGKVDNWAATYTHSAGDELLFVFLLQLQVLLPSRVLLCPQHCYRRHHYSAHRAVTSIGTTAVAGWEPVSVDCMQYFPLNSN